MPMVCGDQRLRIVDLRLKQIINEAEFTNLLHAVAVSPVCEATKPHLDH